MIAENIVHFARVLRGAGLMVGPDRVLQAITAVELVGFQRRDDVHAALSAVMLDSHEQQPIFDAAFEAYWRDPKLIEQLMHALLPKISGRGQRDATPRSNRLQEALSAGLSPDRLPNAHDPQKQEAEFEATFTFSERERLQKADFESMTTAEFEQAKKLAEQIDLPIAPVKRRRHEPAPRGHIDLRATLLTMARSPHTLRPAYTQPRSELPPLVVLLDISGSMERYSRVLLHWVQALTRKHPKLHVLTFGTRLTNISRSLRHRDPDEALRRADAQVHDWKGGTRIASCLDEFNHRWARRLLGGNAAVLLMTDGLDRDEHGQLAVAAEQLRRRAHQVVWLNPLLRYEGFEPRAAGVRALMPHVDRFLPVHNLASLADLGRALRQPPLPSVPSHR